MNITSTTQTNNTTSRVDRKNETTDTEYKKAESTANGVVDTQKTYNKNTSVVKNFLNDLYSNESTSFKSSVIKNDIENKVNKYAQLMMDERGTATESELQTSKLLNTYKKELLQEYKTSIENSTDTVMSAEQEAIIKLLMKENTQETNSLETLLATTNKTDATEVTKATGKMAEMQEKYKDVYTPIPETYTIESEELQQTKIKEVYPDYISGPEFLKILDSFLEGPRIQLGQKLTPDEVEKQKLDYEKATTKAFEQVGGKEEFIAMTKGAHEIMREYPVNNWGKDDRVHNATELARFTNAATYEGLEQGKTIEEAKIYAGNLRSSFMDTSYSTINFLETLIKAGRADPNALDWFLDQDEEYYPKELNDIDFEAPNNSTMDLRAYGIEGSWEFFEVVENQKAMIEGIEKKISQFNFMLNNESNIKEAYLKLDGSYQDLGNNAGYKKLINEDYMPRMQEGLNIFKKYTIYDS